jgi:hypothetical protein
LFCRHQLLVKRGFFNMAEVNGNLLVKGQHLNLKPETFVTDPLVGTLGAEARVWFNSTTKALKLFDGTAIVALGEGGGVSEQEVTDAIAAALIPYAESADVTTEIATAVSGLVNTTALNNAIDNALAGLDFQADVAGLETDYVDTPGRYIYVDGSSFTSGVAASAGDIVTVDNTGAVLTVAYDVSAEGAGALAWNTTGVEWLRWNGTDWAEFGGLTGFTAGDGIEKTGDVVSVKLDGATLTKGVNGLKVGDLSATYVTPAALATATADFQTEAEVAAAITAGTSTFQTAAQVGTLIDTALTPYAESADVTAEIATAVTGLASTASVTSAIDNALSGLDFQSDILGFETDFAGVAGRYILIDGLSGITPTVGNANDIVEVTAGGEATVLDYDVSVAGPGALVWNRAAANGGAWYRWNGTNWAVFGGLSGVTAGNGIADDEGTISVLAENASILVGVAGIKVGDLSATYVTPAAQTAVLADYVLETDLTTTLAGYATDAEVTTQIGTSFFAFDSGATSATTHTVTHNLGFQFPIVQVIDRATNMSVIPESIEYTSVNELVITLGVAATLRASVSWVNA